MIIQRESRQPRLSIKDKVWLFSQTREDNGISFTSLSKMLEARSGIKMHPVNISKLLQSLEKMFSGIIDFTTILESNTTINISKTVLDQCLFENQLLAIVKAKNIYETDDILELARYLQEQRCENIYETPNKIWFKKFQRILYKHGVKVRLPIMKKPKPNPKKALHTCYFDDLLGDFRIGKGEKSKCGLCVEKIQQDILKIDMRSKNICLQMRVNSTSKVTLSQKRTRPLKIKLERRNVSEFRKLPNPIIRNPGEIYQKKKVVFAEHDCFIPMNGKSHQHVSDLNLYKLDDDDVRERKIFMQGKFKCLDFQNFLSFITSLSILKFFQDFENTNLSSANTWL